MSDRQTPGDMTVRTRLGPLHVQQRGSGPFMVLWHSLFVDSTTWGSLLEPLTREHRLIVIDGPSHGRSAPAQRRFTLDECADVAEDVLDHLGIDEPVDWLGNAWGGHVGIVFAASRPDRCRSLVTIGTPVHALSRAERPALQAVVALYRATGPIKPLVTLIENALLGRGVGRTDPVAARLVSDAFRRADRRGMHTAMRSVMLNRPDLTPALPRITVPTLFIAGADDKIWTPAQARRAAMNAPHGGSASVPGAGHVAPLLNRSPVLLNLLRAFWLNPTTVAAQHAAIGTSPTETPAG